MYYRRVIVLFQEMGKSMTCISIQNNSSMILLCHLYSAAPDKALLGDRHPYSTLDDEFAQLFSIVQVIRHDDYRSSLRYYDIALFRLDGNIR